MLCWGIMMLSCHSVPDRTGQDTQLQDFTIYPLAFVLFIFLWPRVWYFVFFTWYFFGCIVHIAVLQEMKCAATFVSFCPCLGCFCGYLTCEIFCPCTGLFVVIKWKIVATCELSNTSFLLWELLASFDLQEVIIRRSYSWCLGTVYCQSHRSSQSSNADGREEEAWRKTSKVSKGKCLWLLKTNVYGN